MVEIVKTTTNRSNNRFQVRHYIYIGCLICAYVKQACGGNHKNKIHRNIIQVCFNVGVHRFFVYLVQYSEDSKPKYWTFALNIIKNTSIYMAKKKYFYLSNVVLTLLSSQNLPICPLPFCRYCFHRHT